MTRYPKSIAALRYRIPKDLRPPQIVAPDGTVLDVWAVQNGDKHTLILRPRIKQQ